MGTAHLLRLLSLFTGISTLQQLQSWTITLPTTISAVEGSCVVVPCQTQHHSRVVWYQYHNIHYPIVYDQHNPTRVENQFKGRTSVLGEAAKGNCTLMINNMKVEDNNLRIYVWINPDSTTNQKFHQQTVTIIVERKAPMVFIQKQIVDGDFFQANCSVKYSCPFSPPSLHWNKSPFLKNFTTRSFSKDAGQGQWLYTQALHGLATYEMHNSEIGCTARFRTFTTESQKTTLNILYGPVYVTLRVEKEPVMEGGSIILDCAANCNPQPNKYIWLKRPMGQNEEITSNSRKKLFNNISRDTSFSCIATNDIGTGKSNWLDLDVQYAPVIRPESSCHQTNGLLKCVCRAEASPNAFIHWAIDGNYTLPSSFSLFSTYKKNAVSGEMSGPAESQSNISCTAENSLGSNTKRLSVILSKTSSLYVWLSASTVLGLLCGCATFIYRKYSRSRLPQGFVCNVDIPLRPQSLLGDVPQEQRYINHQRSQDEDEQSCRSDCDPEEDRLSCVYDNDFLEEMIRPPVAPRRHNMATAPPVEVGMQPQVKVQSV
ncbi:myelin-associated glycoprotein-like [Centropristis striata]|uniref:myelin-associated glycoprotein-like n=1 Tax=Centropristis striata TaxID=184440 RepID=UPI0027E139CF|nr:myelin-associated glycoprotein-like [Centropristis striata]